MNFKLPTKSFICWNTMLLMRANSEFQAVTPATEKMAISAKHILASSTTKTPYVLTISVDCLYTFSGVFRMPPRIARPIFFTKNLQAQCMDVWCKAFCSRHIYFKNSVPECTRTCRFHSENKKKFLGGAQPPPQAPTQAGGGDPLPHSPTPSTPAAPRSSRLRRSTVCPLYQNPKYATVCAV